MLLIDALYINNSGGMELLKYLVNSLEAIDCEVFYLFDDRCCSLFDVIDDRSCLFLKASIRNRYFFYRKNANSFDKVLCFGNIPPPIKMNACVYTYFHNINLLNIPNRLPFITRVLCFMKQRYIASKKQNTDYWIAQTSNTKNEIGKVLHIPIDQILLYPFYQIEKGCGNDIERNDYVYIANYTPSKQHLFLVKAWRKLYQLGYNLTLHLTLSNYPASLENEIVQAMKERVKIVNHGNIDKDKVLSLYRKSKAIVYPSVNESLGLGIIEALSYGCDVIGPDLPYIHSVCVPSATFSLDSVDSLVESIITYEKKQSEHSKLLIYDTINELVKRLQ